MCLYYTVFSLSINTFIKFQISNLFLLIYNCKRTLFIFYYALFMQTWRGLILLFKKRRKKDNEKKMYKTGKK